MLLKSKNGVSCTTNDEGDELKNGDWGTVYCWTNGAGTCDINGPEFIDGCIWGRLSYHLV